MSRAETLKPVVAAGSPTAVAIDEYEANQWLADALFYPGIAAFVVGGATLFASLPTGVSENDRSQVTLLEVAFVASAVTMILGSATMWGATIPREQAMRARARAFTTYDEDLKKRLGLRTRSSQETYEDAAALPKWEPRPE